MTTIKVFLLYLYLFSEITYGSQESQYITTLNPEKIKAQDVQKGPLLTVPQKRRNTKIPSHEELLHFPRKNYHQNIPTQNDQAAKK